MAVSHGKSLEILGIDPSQLSFCFVGGIPPDKGKPPNSLTREFSLLREFCRRESGVLGFETGVRKKNTPSEKKTGEQFV